MDSKLQTEKVVIKKEKLSLSVEQIVENDISLPDYCGDIVKILNCVSHTDIFSAAVTGDKVMLDGSVVSRVLYVDGEGKADIFECAYPFSRSVDIKDGEEGDTVLVSPASEQINCRAVNRRRADIRGSVTLKITVTGTGECGFITDAPADFCHCLKTTAEGSFLLGSISKSFALSSSEQLPDGVKQAKVYFSQSQTAVNEIKTIKNKLMIKGSVSSDIVLLADDGAFTPRRVNIPVNQILDMEGIDENTRCCVRLSVMSEEIRITPDTPQSPPSLEVSVTVSAVTDAYKTSAVTVIEEAYSPSSELLVSKNTLKCVSNIQRVNDTFTVSSQLDFSSCKARAAADANVKKLRFSVVREASRLVCKGNINLGLVLLTADNEKLYFERVIDFEYEKQTAGDGDECEFTPDISVNAVSCSIDAGSRAAVTAELRIDGFAYFVNSLSAVTYMEKGKELQRDTGGGCVTVYFASSGERLWDIAKNHGTSVEKIKEANEISDDTLVNDCMLVFELE